MDDLVQFLTARLDEDEQAARAVGYERIETADHLWGTKYLVLSAELGGLKNTTEFDGDLADHIARHDPARVLAEVDAKRRALSEYDEAFAQRKELAGTPHSIEGAVRLLTTLRFVKLLALPYADHADYRDEWRP